MSEMISVEDRLPDKCGFMDYSVQAIVQRVNEDGQEFEGNDCAYYDYMIGEWMRNFTGDILHGVVGWYEFPHKSDKPNMRRSFRHLIKLHEATLSKEANKEGGE